jgi:Ca2+/H+ antiporter
VTFGNFPELVIAFFALIAGLHEVVKASIIGSIIGNDNFSGKRAGWSRAARPA